MFSVRDIIPCMKKLSNTECIVLAREDILNCEENIVKPHGPAFIKLFHHFTYVSPGVVDCKYVKGVGHFNRHHMNQIGMYFLTISFLVYYILQFPNLLTQIQVFWIKLFRFSFCFGILWHLWGS